MLSLILAMAIGQTAPIARPREGRHSHHGQAQTIAIVTLAPPLPLAPAAPLPLASPVACPGVCVSHATYIIPRGAGRARRHGCRLVRGLVRLVFAHLELGCK